VAHQPDFEPKFANALTGSGTPLLDPSRPKKRMLAACLMMFGPLKSAVRVAFGTMTIFCRTIRYSVRNNLLAVIANTIIFWVLRNIRSISFFRILP
jgi:hypothetical protein